VKNKGVGMKMKKITGVVPATITPFTDNEQVDYQTYETYASWLYENGVNGLCACGSTGEYEALSFDEKVGMYRTAAKISKHFNGYTIACVGGGSTREAILLAEEAEKAECDVLLVLPAYYYGFQPDELMEYFGNIAKSTSLQIMVYHNPGKTQVMITPEMVGELASKYSNVSLVKDSSADVRNILEIENHTDGKVSFFNGWDSIAYQSLAVGAHGLFSGCGGNVIPGHMVKLYELMQEGKYEQGLNLFKTMLPLLEILDKGRLAATVKAGIGINTGLKVGQPRRPYFPATDEEKAKITTALLALEQLKQESPVGEGILGNILLTPK
jgi:4-hydroxy-tetrahydrodipicolinate synthase